ncbi:MAG: DUF1656 domain-containing protein [Rhodospirillales bacterium]|nr:DUF1656 domain-containing protein [Rhodospirillales bacterium]
MIEQLNIFGGFVSLGLAVAIIAGILTLVAHVVLQRLRIDRFFWRPILLDLTLFLSFWWGLSIMVNRFLPLLIAR